MTEVAKPALADATRFVLPRVMPTEPPSFKRNLDPAVCRDRFRAALPA
jgi:hypothetical protein